MDTLVMVASVTMITSVNSTLIIAMPMHGARTLMALLHKAVTKALKVMV